MVMAEMDKPRDTFILGRGDYRNQTEKVTPGVPPMLPPLPKDAPRESPGPGPVARSARSIPLTARVAVNRYWQMYFGTGLVKTTEDFGSQGERPAIRELLDWLATEFVRTGWDIKAMQRLIVTSATYRQSSHVTPELLEKDPENRLLARGPRFRLPAEMVRDNALAVSGLLDKRIGGPSVFPYQPPGSLGGTGASATSSPRRRIAQSTGTDLYRRSMYTFWKRTVPARRAQHLRRARPREVHRRAALVTNTPLQALVLLNDPTYVEAARALAQRALLEAGRDAAGARSLCSSAKPPRAAPRPPNCACSLDLDAARARPLQEGPCAGGQTARRRRLQTRQRGSRASWPPGPRWPAPSSISTRPSPRNSSMDITSAPFLFAPAAPASASPRSASLLSQDGFAAAARNQPDRRPCRDCPTSRPRPSASIFLHQSGGPSQIDLFDYKPTLDKLSGTELPGLDPHGPAHHRHDIGPELVPRGALASSSSRSTASPARGSANCCRTPRRSSTTSPSSRPMNTDAINHDPGHHLHPDRQPAARPPQHGRVGQLRPGQREPEPAGVRRDDLAGAGGSNTDQPLFSRLWGSGFLPSKHQGVRFRSGSDPVLYLPNPAGHRPAARAATCSTASPS